MVHISDTLVSRHIAELIAGEGVTAEAGEARGWDLRLDIIPVSWAATGGGREIRYQTRTNVNEDTYNDHDLFDDEDLNIEWLNTAWFYQEEHFMLINVKVGTSSFHLELDAWWKDSSVIMNDIVKPRF